MAQNDDLAALPLLQERLFELLRQASWVHQYPDQHPNGSRWTGAIIACHAVSQFIHDAGWSPELAVPLLAMQEGFRDLERGITPPIFSLNSEPLKRDRSLHHCCPVKADLAACNLL